MKAFVTGGNGFMGKGITEALVNAGWEARCMVRGHGEKSIYQSPAAEKFVVFEANASRMAQGLYGCQAVFNLVGIIREFPRRNITFQRAHIDFTRQLLQACERAGVKRYLHLSALGVDSGLQIGYNTSKLTAEESVRQSGLNWTIFRPSLIFGTGDRFAVEFAGWMKKGLPIPVIGKADYRLMPLARKDICNGMVKLITEDSSYGETYDIGGPQKLTYIDILKIIEKAAERKMKLVKIPEPLIMSAAKLLGRYPWFPATVDMIKQLLKESVTDDRRFWEKTGIEPVKLENAISEYV